MVAKDVRASLRFATFGAPADPAPVAEDETGEATQAI
jgi:hypothetical protein